MESLAIILIFIALSLVGYVVWKVHKVYKDEGKIRVSMRDVGVVVAGFALFIAGGAIMPEDSIAGDNPTQTKEEKSWDDLTDEEKFKKSAIEVLGDKANTDEDRVDDIIFTKLEGESLVTYKLNADENLTVNYTKKSILISTKDLLEELSDRDYRGHVNVMWSLPLTDQYGNESNYKVMSLDFKAGELSKINYEKFKPENLPNIADKYFEHPSFSE